MAASRTDLARKPASSNISTPSLVFDPADILEPPELAKRLKVPTTWIYERTRRRTAALSTGASKPLPYFRLGKYLRFSWVAVSAWLAEQGCGR